MKEETIRTVSGVLESRVQDCLYLLEPKKGTYYELNASGSLVWQWLREGENAAEGLVKRLSGHFGIAEAVARKDLEVLVEDLVGKGLIEVDDGAA